MMMMMMMMRLEKLEQVKATFCPFLLDWLSLFESPLFILTVHMENDWKGLMGTFLHFYKG